MGQPLLFAAVPLTHRLGNGGARWAAALPAAVVVVYSWDVRKKSPSDMTRPAVLMRLLGAPTEVIRVFGKDLDFPKGAAPTWRRWIPPAEFWQPMEEVDRVAGVATRIQFGSADVEALRLPPQNWREIGPFDECDDRVLNVVIGLPPRLPLAKLSYAELHDLRVAFRRIDTDDGEESVPEWASDLEKLFKLITKLSENSDLMLRARVDSKFNSNSPEARFLGAVSALSERDAAAALIPPMRRLMPTNLDGFGTLPPFSVRRNRNGRPLGPSDFLEMCEAVGLTDPKDVADVTSLEIPEKTLVRCLESPVRYWGKALDSYRRQKLAARSKR